MALFHTRDTSLCLASPDFNCAQQQIVALYMSNVNIKAYTQGLAVRARVWGRCLLIQYGIIP